MLKDSLPSNQSPSINDLEVKPNLEVDKILEFIDNNISSFCPYYLSIKDSDRENRISDFLVHHLQLCKIEQFDGFCPYDFRKNPTQQYSDKETDIGVFIMSRGPKPIPIIEFEAKRLSETSNNKEYVSGDRGGIERFKRGYHSSHLTVCGMFGYVQSRSTQEWIIKINDWIEALSKNNNDQSIDWQFPQDQLVKAYSFPNVEKFSSHNFRKQSNDVITIWHYLIVFN
jgi:hypothetical protein